MTTAVWYQLIYVCFHSLFYKLANKLTGFSLLCRIKKNVRAAERKTIDNGKKWITVINVRWQFRLRSSTIWPASRKRSQNRLSALLQETLLPAWITLQSHKFPEKSFATDVSKNSICPEASRLTSRRLFHACELETLSSDRSRLTHQRVITDSSLGIVRHGIR